MRAVWTVTLVGISLSFLVSGAALGSQSEPPDGGGVPPGVRVSLLALAWRGARLGGDRHPYDIRAVRTAAWMAERIALWLPAVPPDAKVYVVALRGHFVGDMGGIGDHPGRFSVMTLIFPAGPNEHFAEAFTGTNRYPNLKSLGTSTSL